MGKSGRAVLQAIIDGHTDPERLLSCIGRVKASRAELLEALRGRIGPHHRFMLKLHLSHIDALDQAIATIEKEVGLGLEPFRQAAKLLSTMPGLSDVSAQRGGGRDRHRHVALRHSRPPAVVGLHVSAQRRKRRQAPKHPAAPRRQVAQDHPGAGAPGPRSRSRAATCGHSPIASAPAVAPRTPSSPWPPRCSPPSGTCCATAPNGTTSAPPTSTAPTPTRSPTA